ncbi:MAG TPA: hypothetical protein DHW82_02490 [Spirochaetia bacterium]|nr:MAG: hypothetical protein A2Y41_07895 [Spirochaetes bacterium GWB1_36_13]HCL55861.1 hypothetical protein [Spirochaetia bacterium]
MGHGPAVDWGKDNASPKKEKLGIILFIVYLLVYIGFIFIGVIKSELMKTQVAFGLNLAVFYGFGLIFFAVILGVIYNKICTKYEDTMNKEEIEK